MVRGAGSVAMVTLFLHLFVPAGFAQNEQEQPVFEYAGENSYCFGCHGGKTYYYYNEWLGREVRERMNPYYIVDSADFYRSNHNTFRCTDCHSTDYEEFPHPGELRMEIPYTCLDCHGGDDTYAEFRFEQIEEEFLQSVHSTKHSEDFTCWMCHNHHEYRISARTNENLKETITYDNNICLSCHADIDKYQLITSRINPNILETHDWLPNQALHFSSVRCIECHTEISDSLLVAHNVQPKELAVRKCVECHSQNSLLMASLYKFQAQERRSNLGFLNPVMLEGAYIIGANRNYYLNLASAIIFGLVIAGIAIHGVLRIIKK